MTLFISHSKNDTRLVELVRSSLPLAGAQIVVYEDLPGSLANDSPHAKHIKELIQNSSAVLLFHTAAVEANEWTKAWVQYEVSQASAHGKTLVVLQPGNHQPKMPLPYFTDVAVLDLAAPESVPQLQTIAQTHGARKLAQQPLARAAVGAGAGVLLGPLGIAAGAIIGLLTTPSSKADNLPRLKCNCGAAFRCWNTRPPRFHCPSCLKEGWFE